ncbi:MAG: hypothetical protein HDT28_02050 [Clostridiales bacterium]|nr:hypothetical protein [Clostridiales bacterium]
MIRITDEESLIAAVNEYGMLYFWDENGLSASSLSDVNFMKLWYLRERAVNSHKIVYGKYVNKKATFVSLEVFPYLAALRRDGYDFDSLTDEGRAPRREIEVMNAIEIETPSYELGKRLEMKGYDGVVASLQNKTYLCTTFKKSAMGSAMLSRPEDIFGYDFVRSAYSLSPQENIEKLESLVKGLQHFDEKTRNKLLSIAI